jgi:hypothetical protein
MSATTATTASLSSTPRRRSLLRWIGGGAATAAVAAAVTLAVLPGQSAADKAREDGKHLGAAVTELRTAQSSDDVNAALTDIQSALSDTREHAGNAVADQVNDQVDALDRAADGFVGSHTSEDGWDVDLYQAELNTAANDLADNADSFANQGPEVQQAFWDGYQDGLNG